MTVPVTDWVGSESSRSIDKVTRPEITSPVCRPPSSSSIVSFALRPIGAKPSDPAAESSVSGAAEKQASGWLLISGWLRGGQRKAPGDQLRLNR